MFLDMSKRVGKSEIFILESESNGSSESKFKSCKVHRSSSKLKEMPGKFYGLQDSLKSSDAHLNRNVTSTTNVPNGKNVQDDALEIRVYRMRFWMLMLFSLCNLLNGMQWVQYTVMADVTMCFYGVDASAVNWTANLYLIMYVPLVFPVSWFMDRMGMRKTLLVGAFCNCLSTGIQCMACTPDSFTYVLASQAIASIGQVFILPGSPFLSALWFGENELSRASAIGVFGNQLGCALGFIFAPLIVIQDCTKISTISYQKSIVAYTLLGSNLILFLLIVGTFKDKPEKPPSLAQAEKVDKTFNFKCSLLSLFKNLHFCLLLIMYGLICGVYFALATLLNSLLLPHFPGKDKDIGWMGLILIVSGLIGSIVAGFILDWKHKFKQTSTAIFILTLISFVAFTGLLRVNKLWIQYITTTILGFFLTSYFPVGFEFGAEITYPESESTSGSLLNVSTMICGFIMTIIGSKILEKHGDLAVNIYFTSLIFVGCVISVFIKCDFRRRERSEDPVPHLEEFKIHNDVLTTRA